MNPPNDCAGPRCGCTPTRRDFLHFTGLGAAALLSPRVFAGPFDNTPNAGLGLDPKHPVPLDKKLSQTWLDALTARGEPSHWSDGAALQHIGMPVAGIGTGTVYLGGDGRLWGWDVFNVPHLGCVPNNVNGVNEVWGANYLQPSKMESPWKVRHGLVLHVNGAAKLLDHTGFPQVGFTGQYPIGQVRLNDPAGAISAVLEVYSPFIPLDYDDSSLPLTVMEVTLKNAGETPALVELEAYLENAAIRYQPSTVDDALRRVARVLPLAGGALVMGAVKESGRPPASTQPDILLADFEADTWEKTGWLAKGDAFKGGPQAGTLPKVTGYAGKSYAHSHNVRLADQGDPDELTGTLTSPVFMAVRRYLEFLLAGGNRPGEIAFEILQGDKVVLSITGENSNQFTPHTLDLSPWQGQELRLRLTDNAGRAWGSIGLDQVRLTDRPTHAIPFESRRDRGSMALAIVGANAQAQAARGKAGALAETPLSQPQEMAVRIPLTIPAKGEVKTTVLIAWHFPQVHPDMNYLPDPRRWLAERFADAAAVITYGAKELPRLSGLTHSFRDTWYGSETGDHRGTLPHWLLERALWTVTALTTNGSYRLTKDRFWGWEGTGCCAGTCNHVWHYGQTAGRLFPQLEIDLRERTDFTPAAMGADGCIGFRGVCANGPCIDGQAGILLRCYREHLSDTSGQFLKRNWPHIQRATDFLVRAEAEGKPNGNDGIFTRRFENTLDAKWGGEIPWLAGMYLAGLAAAAAMAEELGEKTTAARWRKIIAMGSAAYTAYFDPQRGYFVAKFTAADLLPIHVGPGCHIDMSLGDFWLAQVGLPAIGNKEALRQAMTHLYQYNFVPDMGVFREKTKPHEGRHYALAGEGGLVMATWPHGGLPEECKQAWQFMYFQECMTGFEHAAAALMVSLAKDETDPLLLHGLTVCRAVHDRYDAARRNPYNEVECSDHYARAMASYGVFIAATGFHCHAPSGLLRFEPKLGAKDFAAPMIAAGAWGRFEQQHLGTRHRAKVQVRFGSLRLARLELTPPKDLDTHVSSVQLAGKDLAHRAELRDGRLAILLAQAVTLTAGQTLEVAVG